MLTHLLAHLPTYPQTYSLTHSLTYLLTYLPTNLLTHSLTYLLTYLLTHSLACLPTYLLTHLPPYLLTYLLTCLPTYLLQIVIVLGESVLGIILPDLQQSAEFLTTALFACIVICCIQYLYFEVDSLRCHVQLTACRITTQFSRFAKHAMRRRAFACGVHPAFPWIYGHYVLMVIEQLTQQHAVLRTPPHTPPTVPPLHSPTWPAPNTLVHYSATQSILTLLITACTVRRS